MGAFAHGVQIGQPERRPGGKIQPQVDLVCKQIQAEPNKSKQIQTKILGFIWFYSSESGLFNGLRAKKLKKVSASPTGCIQTGSTAPLPRRIRRLVLCGFAAHVPGSRPAGGGTRIPLNRRVCAPSSAKPSFCLPQPGRCGGTPRLFNRLAATMANRPDATGAPVVGFRRGSRFERRSRAPLWRVPVLAKGPCRSGFRKFWRPRRSQAVWRLIGNSGVQSVPSRSISRSLNFWILPEGVAGSASRTTSFSGMY